jgi:phospholipase D1/2
MHQGILKPGANCCAVASARRVALIVDGADYFRAFHQAAQRARHSIRILGWDFNSRLRLHFDPVGPGDPPAQLGDFLNWLVRHRRGLHIRALNWDYPMVFGADRELRPLYGFGWTPARRVHLRYDDTHPFAGSQHQKVVVIDDAMAFAGGIDLTRGRWDTVEHRAHDPRRGDPDCPPQHDLMMAVDGEAARALGQLARARWRDATGEALRPCPQISHDPWPEGLGVDISNVSIGIARTMPPRGEASAVAEIERLYLDMIAAAKRSIYIENQYFTSPVIAGALEKRLAEENGPEVIVVLRLLSHGWLEEHTMHVLRTRLIAQLMRADHHGRLRVLYPHLPGLGEGTCLNVHAKLMIVDDRLLRIGSSNLSSRSMGVDTECDLAIDADAREDVGGAIRGLRSRLLAEHLDCEPEALRAQPGALREEIDALSAVPGQDVRTLRRLEDIPEWPEAALELASVADPAEPIARDFLELAPLEYEEEELERPAWGRLALIVVVLASLAAFWRLTPLADVVTPEAAIAWAKEFGNQPWAPFVVALAYTPGSFVLFPRPLITLTAVIAFGSWLGFGVALSGLVLAAAANYFSGRRMRRDTVRRLAGRRLDRMIDVLRRHGLLAMTLLRLVPLAPFAVEGIVAGAVRLKLWHLLAGTAIGVLPGTLAMTLFGEQIELAFSEGGSVNWWVVTGIGVLLTGGSFAVRRWFRRMAGGTRAPAAAPSSNSIATQPR